MDIIFLGFSYEVSACNMRDRLRDKFDDLDKGIMTITDYKTRFYALSKHAVMNILTEKK